MVFLYAEPSVPGVPLEFTPAKAGAGMNGVSRAVGVSALKLRHY